MLAARRAGWARLRLRRGAALAPARIGGTTRVAVLRTPGTRLLCDTPKPEPPSFKGKDFATLAGIGGSVGVFGSLVGVGGGIFIVPLLTSFLRMTQHQAQATSLASVASTGLSGATTYALNGAVDPQVALVVAGTAMATMRYGVRVAQGMDGAKLKRIMGFFILAISPAVPLKTYFLDGERTKEAAAATGAAAVAEEGSAGGEPAGTGAEAAEEAPANDLSRYHARLFRADSVRETVSAVAIGAASGFASGMFGIGGGLIVTPALAVVFDVPQQLVLGTTLAAMVPPSLLGTYFHFRIGNLMLKAVPFLVGGSVVGAAAGSQLALGLPEEWLRWLFTGAMVIMGGRMAR